MNTDRELMQQALEALEQVVNYFNVDSTETKTIIALRERLAQPDPVAYWHSEFLKHNTTSDHRLMEPPPEFIHALMYDVAKRDSEAQQAYEDAFVNGTGVMLGDKRIDPASIYKQPEQEPVAIVSGYYGGQCVILPTNPARILNSNTALYTSPPRPEQNEFNHDWDAMAVMVEEQQRMAKRIAELEAQLKPLTDEELQAIADKCRLYPRDFARAIEAAHGITGEQHG